MARPTASRAIIPRELLALAGVLVLGVAIRLVHITQPIAGYFAYNEAYYLMHGITDSGRGWLSALISSSDPNNPPLFLWLVSRGFSLAGANVVWPRVISVAASALTAAASWSLARTLFNREVALTAAVMTLLAPGFALVGRTAQPDALMVALITAGCAVYALAVRHDRVEGSTPAIRTALAVGAGLLLGLATLAKLPAALALAGIASWEVLRLRGFRRLVITGAVWAVCWLPWYIVRFATGVGFASSQGRLFASAEAPTWRFLALGYGNELLWMLSPVIAILALAGLFVMGRARTSGDVFVLSLAAVYAVFYLFFRYHSYYLAPLTPFLAIAAARALTSLVAAKGRGFAVAVAVVCAATLWATTMALSGSVWGGWSPATLPSDVARARQALLLPASDPVRIVASEWVWGNFGPVLRVYAPTQGSPLQPATTRGPAVRAHGFEDAAAAGPDALTVDLVQNRPDAPAIILSETIVRPVVFGVAIAQDGNDYLFANGPLSFERVGPLWRFGLDRASVPSGLGLYRTL